MAGEAASISGRSCRARSAGAAPAIVWALGVGAFISDMGVMVLQIPLGDLLAGGEPDIVELLAVGDEIPERADAEGLADDMRMQAHIHEAPAFGALRVEPVELLFEH